MAAPQPVKPGSSHAAHGALLHPPCADHRQKGLARADALKRSLVALGEAQKRQCLGFLRAFGRLHT